LCADGQNAGSYGTPQKTSYAMLIFVFVPLMTLTGIAQSPGFTAAMPWLLDMFGGRQTARTLHTIGTVMLVLCASPRQVLGLILRDTLLSVVLGIAAGLPLIWAAGRLLSGLF
jgi:thiosulfate reductase cytochrome b subunit